MFRRTPAVIGLVALVAVALAAASSGQPAGPPGGSPPGLDKAIAAKERHAQRLLDTPGIAGIGVGLNPAGKPVIRIYKEKPDVAGIPDSLDDVPVQTVTTGILQARAPTDPFPRPVPIGVSSGHLDTATGTLGARVTNGTDVYALSNNHVYAAINTASIGDGIIQPGNVDGGSDPDDRIGTLHDFQTIDFTDGQTNTIDAALALTSTANVGTATPADGYGTPSPVTAAAVLGQGVQKYGRTTGLQLGTVAELSMTVDVCYLFIPPSFCLEDARFVNQIAITPDAFSAGGDSGSLIVTQGGNQPVALLFAGGEGRTIGNPIDLVLQRFGVTIDGSPPPDGPPSAPTSLAASPGDASASVSWNAPSFTGGSPITGYQVYRGTSPNPTTSVAQLGVQTSYPDTGLVNGTTYYYKVSALNANGEGPLSGQAQATPTAVVPPSAPLPTLDNFDDGFENPLSDQGRWANGVSGGEVGLYVPSVWLACSIMTTCTGWRKFDQYGPDSEVYARLSVLPGDSNQLRLYARLQQPGTSTYDAYMLRTTQLSGTDQVSLERVDNGTIVPLLTINQELVAGDLLLLRVQGQMLEAWLRSGSWSRIGVVADATYGAAGYVGVGLRGTTGRADDFGARTMGASPPPDTTPPSAPGTLAATPASATQIDLSWGAATDDSGTVAQYLIERCSGPPRTFAQVATVGGATTSYSNTGLSPSTAYSYRVRARDGAPVPDVGPYSNTATATTPAPPDATPPSAPLPTLDDFDDGFENPLSDQGRWANGVSARRSGPVRPLGLARLLDHDDLHRLAEVRPVRPRQRGLRAALGAARRLEPAPPVRAPAAAGHLDLRRLHAAHDPALGDRPGLAGAGRQRHHRPAAHDQPGTRRRRPPAPARPGAGARGLAQSELLVADRGRRGCDLQRRWLRWRRPARDDRPRRRLRGAHDGSFAAARHRHLRARREPSPRPPRARPRSTSPGGRPPTTRAPSRST